MVVAQLAERSLPTSEDAGSNPLISNFYTEHVYTVNCFENAIIKKKRPGMAHLKNEIKLF